MWNKCGQYLHTIGITSPLSRIQKVTISITQQHGGNSMVLLSDKHLTPQKFINNYVS